MSVLKSTLSRLKLAINIHSWDDCRRVIVSETLLIVGEGLIVDGLLKELALFRVNVCMLSRHQPLLRWVLFDRRGLLVPVVFSKSVENLCCEIL